MRKKLVCLGMVMCMLTSVLTGCGGKKEEKQPQESQPKKLVFTYVTAPLNVPSIVDDEKDMFENALEGMNVDVEYAELTSGADQTQALASGDVQVLYGVGASSVILSAANGADIKILNTYSRSPKAFCMYAKDKKITSPKDLKGKKIAGPAGTNLHELLAAYLATENMSIQDVDYVDMTIPESKAALDGGSVDVALLAGATAYQAKQQGYPLVTDGEGLIDAIIVVAVTNKFYTENPQIVEKLKLVQQEIATFMKENKEETLRMVADELDLDVTAVKEMYEYYDFSTEVTEKDKQGFQKTADFMLQAGMIEKKLDTNTLFL